MQSGYLNSKMKEGFQRRAKGSTFKLVASSCRRLAATARWRLWTGMGHHLSERIKMVGNGIGVMKDILVTSWHFFNLLSSSSGFRICGWSWNNEGVRSRRKPYNFSFILWSPKPPSSLDRYVTIGPGFSNWSQNRNRFDCFVSSFRSVFLSGIAWHLW